MSDYETSSALLRKQGIRNVSPPAMPPKPKGYYPLLRAVSVDTGGGENPNDHKVYLENSEDRGGEVLQGMMRETRKNFERHHSPAQQLVRKLAEKGLGSVKKGKER